MTRSEIIQKFGDQEVARQLIDAKMQLDEQTRATQVRANPDLHGLDTKDRLLCLGLPVNGVEGVTVQQ